MSENKESTTTPETNKEVPLAPACLIVVIIFSVIMSVVCAFLSWYLNQNQSENAARALREQLIPWVEQSALEPTDKESISSELGELARQMDSKELNEGELRRLRFCLTDNPVLMWGFVQAAVGKIEQSSELTDLEKEQARLTADRLLRLVEESKLTRSALEFTLQTVTLAKSDRSGLVVKDNPTTDDLRTFMKRGAQQADGLKASTEPYDKSPAQVFHMMIDAAMEEPKMEEPKKEK
jgi:hypothetical protein